MKPLRTVSLLWLWLVAAAAAGQVPIYQMPGLDRITADEGLGQTQVNSLLQDRRGFLWIGTIEGLHRYDGQRFTTWRKSPTTELPSNDIRCLFEARDGKIWIGGYQGGLSALDPTTETFQHFAPDDALPGSLGHPSLSSMWQDAAGNFWLGTYGGGLETLDPASGTFSRLPGDVLATRDGPAPRDFVTTLLAGDAGDLWVATLGGLFYLPAAAAGVPNPSAVEVLRHDPADSGSLSSDRVHALAFDARGGLWVGSDGGLDRFDAKSRTFEHFRHDPERPESLVNDRVQSLLWTDAGLWVGTADGLDIFTPESRVFRHHAHRPTDVTTLSDDRVLTLLEDQTGLLWIGTRLGLNKLNPRGAQFGRFAPDPERPTESIRGHRIRSVTESRDGTLWVGTRQGLNAVDRRSGKITHYAHDPEDPQSLGHDDVTALYEDHEGVLWMGTPWSGLSRLARAAGTFEHLRHDPQDPTSLASDDLLWITEDADKRLWIATYNGLSRFNRQSGTFASYRHDPEDPSSLSGNQVYCLYTAPDGALWIGTESNGANRFDAATESFVHYGAEADPSWGERASRIYGFHGEPDGTIWLATWGGGLLHLDPQARSVRIFDEHDGLASDSVYNLLPDGEGNFWISTTHGLSRFDLENETFRNYSMADGLPSNEFSLHSAHRGRRELFFGGIAGLVYFEPAKIQDNLHVPNTVLTSFRIRNQAADLATAPSFLRQLELRYEDDLFSLSFAALDFIAPEKNRYRYTFQRSGESEVWNDLGTQTELTFSDLDPGDYVLRVQGSNNQRVWDQEGLRLDLRVAAPFWQTWWFRLALALVLLGAAGLVFELRTTSMRRHATRLQAEILDRRKAEVERERLIAELEAKNTELERFNYTVSHDLKSPLVTVRAFLGYLERDALSGDFDRMRRDMQRIAGAVDTMQSLLDELLRLSRVGHQTRPFTAVPLAQLVEECAELIRGRFPEDDLTIAVSADLPVVLGDRIRLFEVFQNLLDNAVKFRRQQETPRVEVSVHEQTDDQVVVAVADNGLGIAPSYQDKVFGLFERLAPEIEGTGIGLALVERIVDLHSGKVWVESEGEGRGSTFFVRLPLAPD